MKYTKEIDDLIERFTDSCNMFYNTKTLVADTFNGWAGDYIDDDGTDMTPEKVAGYILDGTLRECFWYKGELLTEAEKAEYGDWMPADK